MESIGSGSFSIDIESTKMQRQLRAIAKHTEALANELAEIDKEVCPECVSADVDITRAFGNDGKVLEIAYSYHNCGYGKE